MPRKRPVIPPSFWIATGLALLVFVFTALLFMPCGDHALLQWDDQLHLLDNPFIRPDSQEPYLHFWRHPYGKMYIPVSYNVWAFLYANSGVKDGVISGTLLHGANVIVHAFNAALVCLLLVTLLRDRSIGQPEKQSNYSLPIAAAAGAMVFAVHPLQVESVAWVSEFRGLLAGMFCLLSLLANVVAADTTRIGTRRTAYSLGVLAFVISALCKPSAAALPGVILIIDLLIKRRHWKTVALWLLPWIVISAAELRLMSTLQPAPVQAAALWNRPFIAGDSAAFYLGRLVWPFSLCADYSRTPAVAIATTWVWVAWTVPIGLLVLAGFARSRALLVSTLLLLAALAPTLGLVPFEFQFISTVADRYAYLAMLGPAWLVATVVVRRHSRWIFAATALCIGFLAWRSVDQQASWQDGRALWTHAVRVNPRAYVARGNLAQILVDDKNVSGAIALFDQMIQLAPNRASGYIGRAKIARDANDFEGAARWYTAAIAADPRDPDASSDLGSMLGQLRRYDEAERHIRRAIEINPDYANGWSNLGVLLLSSNRPAEAVGAFDRALSIVPNHALATRGLQNARAALLPIPADPETLSKLASESMARQDYVAAGRYLKQLAELTPDNLWVANTTAEWLAQTGRYDEAIAAFERLVQLHPELPELRSNLVAVRQLKARASGGQQP